MKSIIKKTINQIQKLVNDDFFKTQHKRNRKINFTDIVLFILGLSNTSFDFERINFCHVVGIESVSNVALSKIAKIFR